MVHGEFRIFSSKLNWMKTSLLVFDYTGISRKLSSDALHRQMLMVNFYKFNKSDWPFFLRQNPFLSFLSIAKNKGFYVTERTYGKH